MEHRQLEDLAWMGIDWDAGTDCQGFGIFRQSERHHFYYQALRKLHGKGMLFPCNRTRRDLQQIASAPHANGLSPYPPTLRPTNLVEGWFDRALDQKRSESAIRFKVASGQVEYIDALFGKQRENVSKTTGDFVLRRRDGLWAYQLAVVVDDAEQGITEVVRGADLLSSTARQVLLQQGLEVATPRYLHVPLLLDEDGQKLSKRNQAPTLRSLRAAGWKPEQVVGYLAWTLGLQENPRQALTPSAMIGGFDHRRISRCPVAVPSDLDTTGPG